MYCENIVIFNSKYHAPADKALTSTDPHYYELARADFAIQTDDKALREQFESIKRHILNNRDKQNG